MKKMLTVLLFVGILLGMPGLASAQRSDSNIAEWIDVATIKFGGKTFFDRNYGDLDFRAKTLDRCPSELKYKSDRTVEQVVITERDSNGDCKLVENITDITTRNHSNGFIVGYRQSADEVHLYNPKNEGDRPELTLAVRDAESSNPNSYYLAAATSVGAKISVNIDSNGVVDLNISGFPKGIFKLANNGAISSPPDGTPYDKYIQDLASTEEDNSCESVSGPLGWIMCPVAGLLDNVTGFLDGQIEQRLELKDDYFTGEAGQGLKAAWTQVRNIAFAVLVPIMLLMVIGTALGFEIFSAYSIKKALPRMVAAVIFITLSWYICIFLIEVINTIGAGVKGLILSPFNNLYDGPRSSLKGALDAANVTTSGSGPSASHAIESFSTGAGLGLVGVLAVGAGFATGAVSVSIIMSTLLSVAVILGIVFLLLIARQMLLIALLIVAPLAILAWIFPDNTKIWNLWWGGFTKLLLLFPVIMLVIAVGQVFALIAGQARGAGDNRLITSVIIIGAYIMPYFFIPFTFKWAGGLFGNIAGMVNDKERGVIDRLRKGRSEKRAQGWAGFKAGSGTGFAQKNRLTQRVGTGIAAGIGGGKGVFGTGITEAQKQRGAARMDHLHRENAIEQVMRNPAWNAVNQNEDALHAGIILQQAGMNREKAIEYLKTNRGMKKPQQAENAVANWQASGLGGQAAAIAAAQQLVSTGTGYDNMEDMVKTLGIAAGGNQNTAMALSGFANSETKKVGRHDLAPGFGTLSGLVGSVAAGKATSEIEGDIKEASADTSQASSVYELMNGKPLSLENQVLAQKQVLMNTSSSAEQKLNASAFFKELSTNLANAKGGNRDVVMRVMAGEGGFAGYADLVNQFDSTPVEDPRNPGNMITLGDIASQRVRAYERPDPNRMDGAQ